MSESAVYGLVLAAGQGTRMNSDMPKCLHQVCGVPMVRLVMNALTRAGVGEVAVVVGVGKELMKKELGHDCRFAEQEKPNGTGGAAQAASTLFAGKKGRIVVAYGDMPLLRASTVESLLGLARLTGAPCVMATAEVANPSGYGRILREAVGSPLVTGIVEEKNADAETKKIKEINPGFYVFDVETLFGLLPELPPHPETKNNEVFLTDMVELMASKGLQVVGMKFSDPDEFEGVNTRAQLYERHTALRRRIIGDLMEAGEVTLVDPETTFVGPEVVIGRDTVIEPNTVISGRTVIGRHCTLGPNSHINTSILGDGVKVIMSKVDQAKMDDNSRCGPFAHMRPGAWIGAGAKIGNFVEVKKAEIGAKASISHLTYIGDAVVGAESNIGAGTITCNYDGYAKHLTVIGRGAFVGSNSTLVAPVTIGDEAMTAAGSVITGDVPAGALGLGRSRQENKEEWAKRWREAKTSDKKS